MAQLCINTGALTVVTVKVTERAKAIEYAIRDVIVHAGPITKMGKKIFYLNIGDPVAFDFPTPQHIRQALIEAVQSGENCYAPSEGVPELRQTVAEKEKRVNSGSIPEENVMNT